jgi:uncharacterized iron-regulated membrane protein
VATSRHRVPVRSARTIGANRPGKRAEYRCHELAAAAGGALLVVVIAALTAWAYHSLSTARPAPSDIATIRPASASSTAQLPSPPEREQLRAWRDEAESSINALVIAGDNVVASATQGDIAGTGAACQTTADAVTSARQHLPSPDPALNTALQQAFNDYEVGIRHCVSGTQKQDAIDIGQGAGFISQGKVDLQKAYAIIEADLPPTLRC